jgi:branched-chain amino acid transport system permease protein
MLDMLPQQLVNGLTLGSTYALIALGLTLVFGVLLIPNFAHGELYMLGAFSTYALVGAGVNFWLAVVIATVIVIALGIVLDRLVFQPLDHSSSLSLMIAALAASIILQQTATIIWGSEPRTTPSPIPGVLRMAGFSIAYFQIFVIALTLAAWGGVWLVLNRSRLGLAIRAVAQNKGAAQLMGIELRDVRLATFAIGALLGGLGGAILSANFPVYPTMGINPVLKAFVVLVLGGIGNLWGAILGGLLLGIVEVMVAGYISSQLQDVGTFLILVLVLLLRPQGLFGRVVLER